MKVLVIGDSYGLPRCHKNSDKVELYYEDVYPERLRRILANNYNEDILLLNHCRHANVALTLLRGAANEVLFLEPNFVVVQLGLVDLWPASGRYVPPLYSDLGGKDPWMDAQEYRTCIERFMNFCSSRSNIKGIILVNIPKVSEDQYQQYPLGRSRTECYNKILIELAQFPVGLVDAYSLVRELGPEAIGSDGIHPTKVTSTKLANSIAVTIDKFLNK